MLVAEALANCGGHWLEGETLARCYRRYLVVGDLASSCTISRLGAGVLASCGRYLLEAGLLALVANVGDLWQPLTRRLRVG